MVYAITGLILGIIFISKIEFSIQLKSYFSFSYLMQFMPLVISPMLLIGGFMLIKRLPNTNFILALIVMDILELAFCDWVGLINSNLPAWAMMLFFCMALGAIWISYSNSFNLKRLSLKDIALSIVFGTLLSLFSFYL